jgi:hypothetical protein
MTLYPEYIDYNELDPDRLQRRVLWICEAQKGDTFLAN